MTDTIRVRPWPGLILAEVPSDGIELPTALAETWLTNHLVVRDRRKSSTVSTEQTAPLDINTSALPLDNGSATSVPTREAATARIAHATQRRNKKPTTVGGRSRK